MTTEELMEEFTRRWNEGDLERYLEIDRQDFRGVWEDVKLRVNTLRVGDGVAAAHSQWVTRGRVSGVEGTIDFAFAVWIEDDLVKRGQFFEEFPDAIRAVGLEP